MAGISVTLEGDNIQIAFQKGEQSTAVVMEPAAARALVQAVGQLLRAIGETADAGDESEGEEGEEELLDVTSPSIDVGLDESGQPVLALQAGQLPPFALRLRDEEARHIADSLTEILNSPRDVRTSLGGH
jgi:hypothetical protein